MMSDRPSLYSVMRSYSPRERMSALVSCAEQEEDSVGDVIVLLISALRKLAVGLNRAKYRANVGLALHELAVSLRQSSIRFVHRSQPHRVTHFPADPERRSA